MISCRHLCVLIILWVPSSDCTPHHQSHEALAALVTKQRSILKEIRNYQQQRLSALERLKRKIERIEQEHNDASADVETYFGNPLNAFRIIKRLVIEWNWIHDFVRNANTTQNFIDKLTVDMERLGLPRESELRGTIGRLINADEATDGVGAHVVFGTHMKWEECYEIAVHLFDAENFVDALDWFEVTLKKLQNGETEYPDFKADVVEYIAFSKYLYGDVPGAYSTVKQLNDSFLPNSNMKEVEKYLLLNANSFSFPRFAELKDIEFLDE